MEIEIKFISQEYSEIYNIEKLSIELSDQDKENILKAREILRDNEHIESIRLNFGGTIKYIYYGDSEDPDFVVNIELLIVNRLAVHFYAESDYHSGDNFESEPLPI